MDQDIESRIQALEVSVNRYRRVSVMFGACAIGLIGIAATQGNRTVLTAQEFRLVNSAGKITAALMPHEPSLVDVVHHTQTSYDSTALFYLAGSDGKPRVVLSSSPSEENSGICLLDAEGRTRLSLSLTGDGPAVGCYDENETAIPMNMWKKK